MTLLCRLPVELVGAVLRDWIDPASLVRLDSASVGPARRVFLDRLGSVTTQLLPTHALDHLKWMSLRSVGLVYFKTRICDLESILGVEGLQLRVEWMALCGDTHHTPREKRAPDLEIINQFLRCCNGIKVLQLQDWAWNDADGALSVIAQQQHLHLETVVLKKSQQHRRLVISIDDGLRHLAVCHGAHLRQIKLAAQLSDCAVNALARHCTQLETLEFCPSSMTTFNHLEQALQANPCLRLLALWEGDPHPDSAPVDDAALVRLMQQARGLRYLHVHSPLLTDACFPAIMEQCSSLMDYRSPSFSVTSDPSTSIATLTLHAPHTSLSHILHGCRHWDRLKVHTKQLFVFDAQALQVTTAVLAPTQLLGLQICLDVDVDAAQLERLLDKFSTLQELHILSWKRLADDIVANSLAPRCGHVTDLALYHQPGLTDRAVRALAVHCPCLQRLSIEGCTLVTHEALAALAAGAPALRHVNAVDTGLLLAGVLAFTEAHPACGFVIKMSYEILEEVTRALAGNGSDASALWIERLEF